MTNQPPRSSRGSGDETKSACGGRPPKVVRRRLRAKAAQLRKQTETEKKTSPREFVVILRTPQKKNYYGWDVSGNLIVDRSNNHFYGSKDNKRWHSKDYMTQRYSVRFSDEVCPVTGWKELTPGHYREDPENDREIQVTAAFQLVIIPDLEVGDITFAGEHACIHTGFLRALQKKFPSPHLCRNTIRACTALGQREYGELHVPLIVSTVNWFVYHTYALQEGARNARTSAVVEDSHVKRGNERTYVPPATLDYEESVLRLGQKMDHESFYRDIGVVTELEPNKTDNGLFTIVESRGYIQSDAEGIRGQFVTQTNDFAKKYRTTHAAIYGERRFRILDASGKNMAQAMSRMYKARDNDEELRDNQAGLLQYINTEREMFGNVSNHPEEAEGQVPARDLESLDTPKELVRLVIAEYFSDMLHPESQWFVKRWIKAVWTFMSVYAVYYFCAFTARLWFYPKNHPKKKLYHAWYRELLYSTGHTYDIPISDPVEAKFKFELAKPGKEGRLYVTYNRSILYAGWLFDTVKTFWCGLHDLGDFLSSSSSVPFDMPEVKIDLVKSLDESYDYESSVPDHGLYTRVFSDDMSSVYVTADKEVLLFDSDISSCDAGNTFAIFYLLGMLLQAASFGRFIRAQFNRLKAKILIRNPSNPREKVVIKPYHIYEGSGCPETTVANFVASFCIQLSTALHIAWYNHFEYNKFDSGTKEERTAILMEAAAAVGHKITVEWRDSPGELQFLKYSPLKSDTGVRVNTRNYGAIFRGYGRSMSDIEAKTLGISKNKFRKMSPEARWECYQAQVVAGLCNEPSSIILDALRARHPRANRKISTKYNEDTTSRAHYNLPVTSLQERYGGEDEEWRALACQIRDLRYGQTVLSPLLTQIYKMDYGL